MHEILCGSKFRPSHAACGQRRLELKKCCTHEGEEVRAFAIDDGHLYLENEKNETLVPEIPCD